MPPRRRRRCRVTPKFDSVDCRVTDFIAEFEWRNKLRVVRIFFDTPVFDKITKDRAAKFVDMLSAIGGTMGLLTGFSIISGVEIIYFFIKIVWNLMKKRELND